MHSYLSPGLTVQLTPHDLVLSSSSVTILALTTLYLKIEFETRSLVSLARARIYTYVRTYVRSLVRAQPPT